MTLPDPFVGPVAINIKVTLPESVRMDSLLQVLADTLQQHPGLAVSSWSIHARGPDRPGSLSDLRNALRGQPEPDTLVMNLAPAGLNWILIKRHGARLPHDTRSPANCVSFEADSRVELEDPADVRQALVVQSALLRALCRRPDVLDARMFRNASCYVPAPPLGFDSFPITIVSRRAVAENYSDPQVYWRSWDRCEELDADRVLVTRALDVLDERAYKRAVYPRIWDLLYAARPGKSGRFDVADIWPGDLNHFNEGEDYLRQLGYSDKDQSVEFTAVVPKGEHLRPREIMVLARYRSDGRLPGGEPLQRVKVTFVDEAMARREMRPLLDAGVEVWCYAPDATLMRVAD